MPGLEQSISNIHEKKKSLEKIGLQSNPKLITIDGPDGAGKSTIANKVLELLKYRALEKNEDPKDVIYVKTIKYVDTKSQTLLRDLIHKKHKINKEEDKTDFEYLAKLWSARANRSYNDHILPLLQSGKTIIVDRSELDILRGAIEWGSPELIEKIKKYYSEGTLTGGTVAGNRIFIEGSAEDMWQNLENRKEEKTSNDPKSFEEMKTRIKIEKESEDQLLEIPIKGNVNVIRKTNKHHENQLDQSEQISKISKEIIKQLKLE